MYIFITYGYPGMRGVQTKGLRLADYLIKRGHKVKFYDYDPDHSTLTKAGVDYESWNFNALYCSNQIIFPKNTKAVIFLALPTNRIGQLSIFLAAKEQNIPIVVVDNYYRSDQLSQKVFANIIKYSDLVILNGLTTPKNIKISSHVKILGPFIRLPQSKDKINSWLNSIGVNNQEKIILGAGYNDDVLKELENLSKKIDRKDIVILALGASEKIKIVNNLIYLPFLDDQQVSNLLSIATLCIYKFGFIQVVEALMNSTPVIVTGGMRGFKSDWLSKEFQDLVIEAKDVDQIKKSINEIFNQKGSFIRFRNRLKKINLVNKNSLKITAQLIEKIKPKRIKKIIKEVVISFDDKKSLQKLSNLLINKPFALPIIFSIPSLRPKEETGDISSIWQFEPMLRDEMLKWDCQLIFRSSFHSFHSGSYLLPFYNELMKSFKQLLLNADKITFCSNEIKSLIKPLIE